MSEEKNLYLRTCTIADAASLSEAVDLGGLTVVAVLTDSGWNAAKLSFAVATSLAGTYLPVKNTAGTELETGSVTGAAWLSLVEKTELWPIRYIKVRSGTSGAAVNQTGATVITLICAVKE